MNELYFQSRRARRLLVAAARAAPMAAVGALIGIVVAPRSAWGAPVFAALAVSARSEHARGAPDKANLESCSDRQRDRHRTHAPRCPRTSSYEALSTQQPSYRLPGPPHKPRPGYHRVPGVLRSSTRQLIWPEA